jgi:ketosteroid isomerase-like protein
MSQENVEVVRRLLEAYNRADFQAIAERCHEDFQFTSVMTAVEETSYQGKDTWERYWHDMHQTWEDWRLEELRFFDGGEDRVAVLMRLVGKGKTSGVPVDREIGIAYRMRDGKMWRARSYLDPRAALEAVGLSE